MPPPYSYNAACLLFGLGGCDSLVKLLPSRYEALDFTTNANHKAPPNSAKLKPVNQLLVYTHHTRPVSLNPDCTVVYHVTFYLASFWNSYHTGWLDLWKCIDSLFLLKYATMNLQPVQWEDLLTSCCLRDSFCKECKWLWKSTHLLTTRRPPSGQACLLYFRKGHAITSPLFPLILLKCYFVLHNNYLKKYKWPSKGN